MNRSSRLTGGRSVLVNSNDSASRYDQHGNPKTILKRTGGPRSLANSVLLLLEDNFFSFRVANSCRRFFYFSVSFN